MTWVVGGKHLFCARCMSDVQVTIQRKNRSDLYFDAVKKVYELGPGLAIAFAGSVKLAFELIEVLQKEFYPKLDKRLFEQPDEIIRKMRRYLLHFYKQKKTLSDEYVEFLVLAAPVRLLTEFGLWKMCAPDFKIIERQKPFELLELGSGATASEFREVVEKHSKGVYIVDMGPNEKPLLEIPVGKVALQYLFVEALDFRKAGISHAMHITLVTHNDIYIREFPETPERLFPKVASSWQEFKQLIRAKGISLADCYAFA